MTEDPQNDIPIRQSKVTGSSTDDNDRIIGARLMNGKSSASNGSGKQVKCTDDHSGLHDCDKILRKHEFNGDRKTSVIKRLSTKIEDFEYKSCIDSDSLNPRHGQSETPIGLKESRTNGDYQPRRPLVRENESAFARSSRYTEDSPDREVENTLRDTNGGNYSNSNYTNGANEHFNVELRKYERSRNVRGPGPDKEDDLVRRSRKHAELEARDNELSRRSSFEYHSRRDTDDKHFQSSRASPASAVKRELLHDRDTENTRGGNRGRGCHESCERDSEYGRSKCDVKRYDRHSRPLTPPTTLADHEVSHNYTINSRVFLTKDPYDDFIRNRNKLQRDTRDLSWIDRELLRYSDDESPEPESREEVRGGSGDNSRVERNGDFSTIERNGTTVIRIRSGETGDSGDMLKQFGQDDDSEDYEEFFDNWKRESTGSSHSSHHDSVYGFITNQYV